ncbi:asparagine-tRNA cytoplasmic-like protein, putative [Babesia ovata]|uniref:Asparagine-tRNA cytoplasmic-like protein, putative n=1 Tax=Babesia ovata TaxID=189622 RepID=A0A2H6KDQ0_9APIC|nr:asparagine-tRNA cytoplasmic-like protein, putative [Babesia ovata]GBE61116.1 asparagine-tRNA cytoplasmic-like protein, putative [Babesia ovata]
MSEQTRGHAQDATEVPKASGVGESDMSCFDNDRSPHKTSIAVDEERDAKRSTTRDPGSFASAGCLAKDASETLFAKIIGRCALQKDFARLAFVLYWLSNIGFPSEMMTRFFDMNLRRMLALQSASRSELCPRDFISVLRYSLHFDIDSSLREALYNQLVASNKKSLLYLTLQDANNLLDCLLEKEHVDQGLLVAAFASIQLCIKAAPSPDDKQAIGVAHSYLAERCRLVQDERAHWDSIFMQLDHLNDLANTFVGRDSLCNFLQRHCLPPSELRVRSGPDVDEVNRHVVLDVVKKLQHLCPTMKEETRSYCVKLIDTMLRSVDSSQYANL